VRWEREVQQWMRERSLKTKSLMIDFPPSCIVRGRKGSELGIPAPGCAAVVLSYGRLPCGCASVKVVDYDVWMGFSQDPGLIVECHPRELVAVSYFSNVTPNWVRQVFKGIDMPTWEN
jgi:hypothetical protein